jgi:hypothetical protein
MRWFPSPVTRSSTVPWDVYFTALLSRFHQYLPNLDFVGHELGWRAWCHCGPRLKATDPRFRFDECHAFLDQPSHVDPPHVQRRSQGLDPGIVQREVDYLAHTLTRTDDLRHLPRLSRVEAALAQQSIRMAQNAVQRRTQFAVQGC